MPLLDLGRWIQWRLLAQVCSEPCEFLDFPVFTCFSLYFLYFLYFPVFTFTSLYSSVFPCIFNLVFSLSLITSFIAQTSGPGLVSGPKYCGEQTTQVTALKIL